MAEHQDRWPMTVLCEVLEVSRSGFYSYLQRQKTRVIDVTERALVARVKAIADDTRGSYGSRRMAKQLQAERFAVGRAKARVVHSMSCFFSKTSYERCRFSMGGGAAIASEHYLYITTRFGGEGVIVISSPYPTR